MPMTHDLSREECSRLLTAGVAGRVAIGTPTGPHIIPVNYAVDHDPATGRRSLLFRTAEGSKLLGVVMNPDVAFEVDEIVDEHATSVLVRGRGRQLVGSAAWVADRLPLRPWVDTPKYIVVEITADEITGRRFDLHRPWLHARVDSADSA